MNSTYAVITSAFDTGPVMHIIIAVDNDPNEALRMARESKAEMRERMNAATT